MRFDPERSKYVVRWREDGSRRVARFDTAEEAEAFEQRRDAATAPGDAQVTEVAALATRLAKLEAQLAIAQGDAEAPGDGVFRYDTAQGVRYGFKFRQSDGISSTRRGFFSRKSAR